MLFRSAASALLFLFFVAFAKQAFCNYYFMVLGCLCCALAMLQPADGRAPPGTGRA